jgi:16S rRNA (adenine1518-N6/adenine1519-N6)-dimethyltransferase
VAQPAVRPKKHLGQHFLSDPNIARRIVESLRLPDGVREVLEIGPGMGVLTQYLLENPAYQTSVVEIDQESVAYLGQHYPALAPRIYSRWPSSATFPTISAARFSSRCWPAGSRCAR